MSITLLVIFLSLVAYYLLKNFLLLWHFYRLKIPQPDKCYPIFGHSLWVLGLNAEDRLNAIVKVAMSFDRMAKFWLGPIPILGILHPDLIQKILTMEHLMEKTPYFYNIFNIDDSLIVLEHQKWKPLRKVFNHSFSPAMLQSLIPTFVECSDKLTASLSKYLDGSPFDLLMYVSKSGLDMLTKSAYGIEEREEDKSALYEKIVNSVEDIHDGISERFNKLWIRPKMFYKLTRLYEKDMAARDFAFNYQIDLYRKRKAAVLAEQENLTEDDKLKPTKIADPIIFNEHLFPEEVINDTVRNLLLAGFETTGNQICHTLLMLAIFPDIQEKAYREIVEIFETDNIEFNIDTLGKLKYTEQVLKETMRLLNIVPFITRTSSTDIELDGMTIPKGLTMFIPLNVIHRREDIWGENPDKFDPENFSPKNMEKRHPFAFIPFSMGKRNCLGHKYAMLAMKVVVAKILLSYKLTTDLKYNELKFLSKISLKLCTPYGIKLTKR